MNNNTMNQIATLNQALIDTLDKADFGTFFLEEDDGINILDIARFIRDDIQRIKDGIETPDFSLIRDIKRAAHIMDLIKASWDIDEKIIGIVEQMNSLID